MDAMKIFTLVGYVLPLINTIVNIVENFPNLSGSQKKDSALGFLRSVWSGLQDPKIAKIKEIQGVPFDAVEPVVGFFIDTLVGVLNVTGVFKK